MKIQSTIIVLFFINFSMILSHKTITALQNLIIQEHNNVQLECENFSSKIKWFKDDKEYGLFNSTLIITNATIDDVGNYKCCEFKEKPHKCLKTFYLFVKSLRTLIVPPKIHGLINVITPSVVIPCKPSFPGVKIVWKGVNKNDNIFNQPNTQYDPKIGFTIKSSTIIRVPQTYNCIGTYKNISEIVNFTLVYFKSENYNNHAFEVNNTFNKEITESKNTSIQWVFGINIKYNRSNFNFSWFGPKNKTINFDSDKYEFILTNNSSSDEKQWFDVIFKVKKIDFSDVGEYKFKILEGKKIINSLSMILNLKPFAELKELNPKKYQCKLDSSEYSANVSISLCRYNFSECNFIKVNHPFEGRKNVIKFNLNGIRDKFKKKYLKCKICDIYGCFEDHYALTYSYTNGAKFNRIEILILCSILVSIGLSSLFCFMKCNRRITNRKNNRSLEEFTLGHLKIEKDPLIPYKESLEFPSDKLEFGCEIGSGAFGRVFKGRAKNIIKTESMSTVAIKTLKDGCDINHIKALLSELKTMSQIGQHPHLVNILGACSKERMPKDVYLILEYCAYGNLREILIQSRDCFKSSILTSSMSLGRIIDAKDSNNSNYDTLIDEKKEIEANALSKENFLTSGDLITWTLQIAKGMDYLEKKKILHGDLACRNVLISENGTAKISDFGMSRCIYKNNVYKKLSDKPLPFKWLAPESLQYNIFTSSTDVWSYGITTWEIFSLGANPYPGMSCGEIIDQLFSGKRLKQTINMPDGIYSIVLECWKFDPKERSSFQTIVQNIIGFIQSSQNMNNSTNFSTIQPLNLNLQFSNLTYEILSSRNSPNPTLETDLEGYLVCTKKN